jgi:glycerate kinase
MRVVIAPDKFKGCLSAVDVAAAMAEGVRDADPSAEMRAALGGQWVPCRVVGPLPERMADAGYVRLGDGTAVVEAAAASGLALLDPADRDPMRTTTFGTGQLIAAAVAAGARTILLALGGSGTVDGGMGCVQACGFTVLTTDGEPTSPTDPLCGRDLEHVLMVKHGRGEVTNGVAIVGLCDVTNPLFGPTGAPAVFGPQKGATPDTVRWLDAQLRRLSQPYPDESQRSGAGAAGGLGFAVAAWFRGTLRSGFDVVAEAVRLTDRLRSADLCLTGEGHLDATTIGGKAVAGVGRLCAVASVPCVAVAGSIAPGSLLPDGITRIVSLVDPQTTPEQAKADARRLLRRASAQIVRQMSA